MNIGNIGGSAPSRLVEQRAAKGSAGSPASSANTTASGASSAAQEAQETLAQTRKEAASGDQQAVRLLAREEAKQSGQNPQAPAAGKGIDIVA